MSAEPDLDLRRRADALFDELLELPADERGRRLEEIERTEPGVASLVARLLAADAGSPAAERAVAAASAGVSRLLDDEPLDAGERVGNWRLVSPLGAGGMARVFVAERIEGGFRQRAALKLLVAPPGEEAELARRFEQERQILAALEHPNFARVLDGGVAPDGRPFLAMELVDGLPLDRFAAERELDLPARVRLLATVARAVQHAHRSLVVHRDLKPSNILVGADGLVKVLDFGIAKVLAGATLLTGAGVSAPETRTLARALTPTYASPEQVRGEAITTASDVYQLGLLLYELLAGRPAHLFREDSWREMERVVCETDPPRIAELDASLTAPGRRSRRVPADLATIVSKALQKEPSRRYSSAEQLAEDLERFLADQPVLARPDTVRYRARKFVRRHRVGVAFAAAFGALVVVSIVLLALQARRLAAERDSARAARAASEIEAEFLSALFEASEAQNATGDDPPASELVARGLERLANLEDTGGSERALLLSRLGELRWEMGDLDGARPLAQEALALSAGSGSLAEAAAANLLAAILTTARFRPEPGQYERAEELARRSYELRLALLGEDANATVDSLARLGIALRRQRRHAEAAVVLDRAVALRRRAFATRPVALAATLYHAGLAHFAAGEYAAAEPVLEECVSEFTRHLGADHPRVVNALEGLGTTVAAMGGRDEEAARILRDALARGSASLPAGHQWLANTALSLATVERRLGRLDDASARIAEAIVAFEALYRATDPRLAVARLEAARCALARGEREAALEHAEQVRSGLAAEPDAALAADLARFESELAGP